MYEPAIDILTVLPGGVVSVGFRPKPGHAHEDLLLPHAGKLTTELLSSAEASKFGRAVTQQHQLARRQEEIDAALRLIAEKQQGILSTPELDAIASDGEQLAELDRKALALQAEKQSVRRQQELVDGIVQQATQALDKLVTSAESDRVTRLLVELKADREGRFPKVVKGDLDSIARLGAIAWAIDRLADRQQLGVRWHGVAFFLTRPKVIKDLIRQQAGLPPVQALAPKPDADEDGEVPLDTWQA